MTGCGKSIQGEVFLEKGGSATKLANVEIQLIPEEDFKKYVKSRFSEGSKEIARLEESIKSREKSIGDIEKSQRAVMAAQINSTMAVINAGGFNTNSVGGIYGQQQQDSLNSRAGDTVKQAQELIDKYKLENTKSRSLIEGVGNGRNSSFYYSPSIPGAIHKATSNSDGKYVVEMKSTGRFAMVAAKGDTYWFIWVNSVGENKINLTNSNSNDTGCAQCIFSETFKPQTL